MNSKTHLILVTHGNIGEALLTAAKQTYNGLPLTMTLLSVTSDMDPATVQQQLQVHIQQQTTNTGILILTDVFGATPCNIANGLITQHHTRIISGVNLPMLLKILNYPQLSLDELVEKALQGGQAGIIECPLPTKK